jgi:hypothetical protein
VSPVSPTVMVFTGPQFNLNKNLQRSKSKPATHHLYLKATPFRAIQDLVVPTMWLTCTINSLVPRYLEHRVIWSRGYSNNLLPPKAELVNYN